MADVEGSSTRKPEIRFLDAEGLHEVNQFDLLLDGGVASARALQTVTQGLVVEPQLMRVPPRIALNLVIYLVPIVNQGLLIHCPTSLYDATRWCTRCLKPSGCQALARLSLRTTATILKAAPNPAPSIPKLAVTRTMNIRAR